MIYWYDENGTAVVKFYADIGWWETDAKRMSALLEQLDTKYSKILFRVHCYGGLVYEGIAIYNSILGLKAETTWRIEGSCMSMGTLLMLACDHIEAADNATIMVHSPRTYGSGTLKDFESIAKSLRLLEKMGAKRYSEKTGKPLAAVKSWFDGADHFMDAEEAKAEGLVDTIIPAVVKNGKSLPKPSAGEDISSIYDRYTALLQEHTPQMTGSIQTDIQMKQLLITALALTGVTAETPDEDFVKAVQAKLAGQGQPTANGNSQDSPNTPSAARAVITSVVALSGKTLTDEQRTQLENIGTMAGMDALTMTLTAMLGTASPATSGTQTPQPATPAAPQIISMVSGGSTSSTADPRAGWTWDDYQDKDPDALDKMKVTDLSKLQALYKTKYGSDMPL